MGEMGTSRFTKKRNFCIIFAKCTLVIPGKIVGRTFVHHSRASTCVRRIMVQLVTNKIWNKFPLLQLLPTWNAITSQLIFSSIDKVSFGWGNCAQASHPLVLHLSNSLITWTKESSEVRWDTPYNRNWHARSII